MNQRERTIQNITTCHPILQTLFSLLFSRFKAETKDFYMICTEGWRDPMEQQKRFDEGVSKALPWKSYHNFGLAFDIAFINASNGKLTYDPCKEVAALARGFPLTWGGTFKSIKDEPHFQLDLPINILEIHKLWEGSANKEKFDLEITKIYLESKI